VIERVRPVRMASELCDLPRGQIGEDAPRERLALLLQPVDFLGDVELGVVADELQRVDTRLELGDRLLEIEELQIHNRPVVNPGGTLTFRVRRSQVAIARGAESSARAARAVTQNASDSGSRSAPRRAAARGAREARVSA